MKIRWNKIERNGESAVISQVDVWWNKSLLWDSSWSSEQFYGNVRERGPLKIISREIFDSIIAEFKDVLEHAQFKEL